jgi:TRAP-type C4-dicarboxylate transport system permease large subunit
MKMVILVLLGVIIIALFTGLFFLMKEGGESKKALNSLIVRVGLSLLLIVLLIVSFYMGWLTPHGVGG